MISFAFKAVPSSDDVDDPDYIEWLEILNKYKLYAKESYVTKKSRTSPVKPLTKAQVGVVIKMALGLGGNPMMLKKSKAGEDKLCTQIDPIQENKEYRVCGDVLVDP